MIKQPININTMAGFTLVEMLISSAISLVLLTGVLSIAMGVMGNSAKHLKRTHLIQELRATMSLMVRDMRRAGYSGAGIDILIASQNNFTQLPYMFEVPGTNSIGDCATYAYDEDSDGNVDTGVGVDERHGFRLQDGKVQDFKGLNGAAVMSCTSTGWESITSDSVTVSALEFDASGEECFNVSVVPPAPVAGCNAASLGTNEVMAKVIAVNIKLVGHLSDDPSVVRTLNDSVKIRNVQTTIN